MLVDGVPAKHPRRTLTLVSPSPEARADAGQIAKMLQNLANKPSYSKEQYMMSLNPFVETNKTRMNHFLNSLCEVGDFYESLEVGHASGDWLMTARSIHGAFEEGFADQHHAQRALQHPLAAESAHGRLGE